jgi:hypothetical protein
MDLPRDLVRLLTSLFGYYSVESTQSLLDLSDKVIYIHSSFIVFL